MTTAISKLLLAQHGYHDKTEHAGFGGGPIETRTWTTEIIDPQLNIEDDNVKNAKHTSTAKV